MKTSVNASLSFSSLNVFFIHKFIVSRGDHDLSFVKYFFLIIQETYSALYALIEASASLN